MAGKGSVRRPGLILIGVLVVAAVVVLATDPFSSSPGDTSPVNLSTPVDMGDGVAHQSAVVHAGPARFEVLSPTLIRLEYSPSGRFENRPTVNALDRRLPVPSYRTRVSGGRLTIRTARATLTYKVGSGPFTAANTSLRFALAGQQTTVHPTWDWECPFDQTCQAGAATLGGGATLGYDQGGYQSSAGYVSNLVRAGAGATWTVLGAPAGPVTLSLRYSEVVPAGSPRPPRQIDLVVDGRRTTTLTATPTDSAVPWGTLTTTASLTSGSNSLQVRCDPGESCGIDLDTLATAPADEPTPASAQSDPLGGWVRGFDTFTYEPAQPCAAGTAGATCQNTFEPLHTDGLLDEAGWRLLDDTQSALWTASGWVQPRQPGGDVEDGYLFVYGHDYAGALRTLAQLTGAAPLLPRQVFGVWYSDYTPYSAGFIEDSLYPDFEKADVPLDTLSLDTDWKSPNNWDGWEWDGSLFPHPSAFLQWARSKGIDVTLNIHSSIALDDPEVPTAQNIAGNTLTKTSCMAGICLAWNWSSVPQAESNFALQQSLQRQGVAFFWLDWCCDASTVNMRGLTPDSWIGHLYAQQMVNQGERGFVLARIGSSNGNPQREYPAGPWSDHTSAIAFTGDAWGTWATLAQEVALTPDEATVDEPYVSDDVGSFLGPPPQGTPDPPDLYDRWVQFGTFQPILRLHSNNEQRLPWQYPQPVQGITEAFLRLREALVPYTYTLAAEAHDDGMPMAQPLYLDYPEQAAAYSHSGEYLYGSQVLVAPVTSPGSVADTTVWIPPGRWVDYFTGATFTGPTTTTVSVPLNRMPVFVRAGGIVPEQSVSGATSGTGSSGTGSSGTGSSGTGHPMVLDVFSGSSGSFSLYADSGTGLGYTKGQSTTTPITDTLGAGGEPDATATDGVTIGPARGHYPGEPTSMAYRLEMVDLTRPTQVTLNGRPLAARALGSDAVGWSYQAATATVVVNTPLLPASRRASVVASGSAPVDRPEPPTPTVGS